MTWTSPLRRRLDARMEMLKSTIQQVRKPMFHVIRFGIDLAKNTFAICGVDDHDHIVVKKNTGPPTGVDVLRQYAVRHDRHGGRLRRPLLGSAAHRTRP